MSGASTYTPNDLFGLIFLIMSGLFYLAHRRVGMTYFSWVSLSMLFASIAWGSTDYQDPGYPYVNWAWWWAQPFFVGTIVFLGLGLLTYLPYPTHWRSRLMGPLVFIPLAYLVIGTVLLMFDVRMVRVVAVWGVLPPFFTIGILSLISEKREPWMGHGLIGLSILSIPALTILVALFGFHTTILRLWTGIPLVFISLMILVISLTREQILLNKEVEKRSEIEGRLLETNSTLERKVFERTLDLQDVIGNLETFNRNISHDLRGPLGSIDVLSHLADRLLSVGDLNGAREQLSQISQVVRSSHATLEGLLALARKSEEGDAKERTDIAKVAESCIREVLLSQGISTSTKQPPKIIAKSLGEFDTNSKMLRIILANLLINAVKFNRNMDGLIITVGRDDTLAKQSGQNGYACLYVNDNGVGIDLNDGADPFLPFQRMSHPNAVEGTGLGLSIVKQVVERQGGTVWLKSAINQGTTVFFTLSPN